MCSGDDSTLPLAVEAGVEPQLAITAAMAPTTGGARKQRRRNRRFTATGI